MNRKFILGLLISFVYCSLLSAVTYTTLKPSAQKEIGNDETAVVIKCNVDDAEVTINGRYQGRTNLTITDLVPGSYNMEIRKDGYETAYYRITVKANYSLSYAVTLQESTGQLTLTNVTSGSDIYVDGYKKTSHTMDLSVGNHDVVVKLFGYEQQSYVVKINANRTTTLRLSYRTCSFALSEYKSSMEVINPEYSGKRGKTVVSFMVTTDAPAEAFVRNENGDTVWSYVFPRFKTWYNEFVWKGVNNNGEKVPDGNYEVVLSAGSYTASAIVKVDREMHLPLPTFTKSGAGIGTIPTAKKVDSSYIMINASFEPTLDLTNFSDILVDSPINAGVLFGLGKWGELGFSVSSFLFSDTAIPVSFNANFKGTFGFNLKNNKRMNIGLLARYGIGSVELFPPYGVDTGNGLGAGLVLGFESKKSYFGFTGEYIFGAENGNIMLRDDVLKLGFAYSVEAAKGLNLGVWGAIHNGIGIYVDKSTATDETAILSGLEAGGELNYMPGSTALLINVGVKVFYLPLKDVYASGKIGLSYLF